MFREINRADPRAKPGLCEAARFDTLRDLLPFGGILAESSPWTGTLGCAWDTFARRGELRAGRRDNSHVGWAMPP
jgi:hypothetical protein